MNKIPDKEYRYILSHIPVCCVDMVLVDGGKALLVRRKNNPERGKWYVIGGRVQYGEKIVDAVIRKTKEETGIDVSIYKYIGLRETVFNDRHTINFCFIVKPKNKTYDVVLDKTSDDYIWTDKCSHEYPKYVNDLLLNAL